MSSKVSKGAKAEKQKDVQETEDPLQAVVLADLFDTHASSPAPARPRCLLPLANVPLIEYTLEYLASTGIEEVFVYCSSHSEQVEAYLLSTKWARAHAPFRLHILRSTSRSIGDAMRDLDKRDVLSNDFIVLYGDVISNIPLAPALAAHRARRAVDKNAIMTMLLRESTSRRPVDPSNPLATFVIDPKKRRCLHYQELSKRSKGLLLDEDVLKQDIDLRADLVDGGIDICTPDVLALWSDNFDYETPRAGFLYGVLKDYELNGKTIHTHIVNDCYAARVSTRGAAEDVSRDILQGRCMPYVPAMASKESADAHGKPADFEQYFSQSNYVRSNSSDQSLSDSTSVASDDDEDQILDKQGSELSPTEPNVEPGGDFVSDVGALIADALRLQHDVSTTITQLQSQRMAQNASEHQVRQGFIRGLSSYIASQQPAPKITELVKRVKEIFERIVFDADKAQKEDQVDMLLLCQSEAAKLNGSPEVFRSICNALYSVEDWDREGMFEGDAFEQWWQDERSQSTEEMQRVRKRLERFVEIVTAEDEDDEDDEEDDE